MLPTPTARAVLAALAELDPHAAHALRAVLAAEPWPGPLPGKGLEPGERLAPPIPGLSRGQRLRALKALRIYGHVEIRTLAPRGLALRVLLQEDAGTQPTPGQDLADTGPKPGQDLADTGPKPGQDLADTGPKPGQDLADTSTPPSLPFRFSKKQEEPDRTGKAGSLEGGERREKNLDALAEAVHRTLAPRYSLGLTAVRERVQVWTREGRSPDEISDQAQGLAADKDITAANALRLLGWRLANGFQPRQARASTANALASRPGLAETEQYCRELQEAQKAAERDRERVRARFAARRTAYL